MPFFLLFVLIDNYGTFRVFFGSLYMDTLKGIREM